MGKEQAWVITVCCHVQYKFYVILRIRKQVKSGNLTLLVTTFFVVRAVQYIIQQTIHHRSVHLSFVPITYSTRTVHVA